MTVKDWKELITFEPIHDGGLDLDGTIEHIAKVKGKTVAEIEAETEIEDILPMFIECVHKANDLVFARLDKMPKNGNGDSQK